jgi:predicted nucleotidyltransferase
MYKLKWTNVARTVFSFLCKRAGEKFSQREISLELNVSPTAVATAVTALAKARLVKRETMKTINFISLNREEPMAIALKRAENLKNIAISQLLTQLEESFPGATILLFGSYAFGEDTVSSDIDIAVIGRKEKAISLEKQEKLLERCINIGFYASWNDIEKELKNNILNGIILHGSVDL